MARVSSEQRRRDLTNAAVQLLIEEGRSAVTSRKIADRAGAPAAIVHYTFRDMDELLELANGEVLDRVLRVIAHLRTDHGVRGLIEDWIRACCHLARDSEKEVLAFLETFVSLLRSGGANSSVVECRQFLVEHMREAEKQDARPSNIPLSRLATLLIITADGLLLMHLSHLDYGETEENASQLIAALQTLV